MPAIKTPIFVLETKMTDEQSIAMVSSAVFKKSLRDLEKIIRNKITKVNKNAKENVKASKKFKYESFLRLDKAKHFYLSIRGSIPVQENSYDITAETVIEFKVSKINYAKTTEQG